ncbi:RES family NAD+ phosphorylase [Pendulispora albinea]|uniref:RES family NAD+ phosphorylase n=1 Tax=Pendulispora albinea TaxID=2741071 RepID=A0ABZ2M0K9_9BACT
MVLDAYRAVESQHVTSTRKLVDSDAEQQLLEELIDTVKPPVPNGADFRGLHYLLYTPFRHPPLRWGSRFGTRAERGMWYGSGDVETCFAEVAYYRLLFLEGTSADLGIVSIELTTFLANIAAERGVDLLKPPFQAHQHLISSKTSYATAQPLGRDMRAAGVQAFLFASARTTTERTESSPMRGVNVGLFDPVFASKKPAQTKYQTWTCTTSRDKVEVARKTIAHPLTKAGESLVFPRTDFEVDGAFPVCA